MNYQSLPVNAPRCPVFAYHRDGPMRLDGNSGGAVNYEPDSFGGPRQDPAFAEPPLKLSGAAARHDHRAGHDDYSQAGDLFRLMPPDAKLRLFGNIGRHMAAVPREIQLRQLCHFFRADPAYGLGVAKELGIDLAQHMPAMH